MNMFDNWNRAVSLTRFSGIVFSAVLGLLTCGCGLLRIPYSTTIPREPLRRVCVRAYESREPVRDAKVAMILYKHDNWMEPVGCWGITESSEDVAGAAGILTEQKRETWQAEGIGDGIVEIAPRTNCSWLIVWLPLTPVLGPWAYNTYDGVIVASAPGWKTIWLTDRVTLPCVSGAECGSGESRFTNGTYAEVVEGVLHVYLPKPDDL